MHSSTSLWRVAHRQLFCLPARFMGMTGTCSEIDSMRKLRLGKRPYQGRSHRSTTLRDLRTGNNAVALSEHLPACLRDLADPQTDLPRIAKNPLLTTQIEEALRGVPTKHELRLHDARDMAAVPVESVHVVLTS